MPAGPGRMSRRRVRRVQRACNRFTRKYLLGVAPLRVDGNWGPHTRLRVIHCKFWLGYLGKRTPVVDKAFLKRLRYPKSTRYSMKARIKRGMQRRVHERHAWRRLHEEARRHGVGTFDGVPVANWMVPYLVWARAHGWRGRLVSGWRSAEYSESLCYRMCGRPSCPGRCAGRSTRHTGQDRPNGALDVSFYVEFGALMARCPISPRLTNHLPNDRVHYSVAGN